ncbi:polypyrimidine tract-binding protein 3 [Neopsephotus bourkii]|uniref:polypyrimidine tract-binding protein 3 n=1 Tax=Neopsephotus bourkii TaxID=309878 RepID=UPI002AA54CB7|nr:polypyrimidine tract-binding protein 3 [Neopsephotus bourkii]
MSSSEDQSSTAQTFLAYFHIAAVEALIGKRVDKTNLVNSQYIVDIANLLYAGWGICGSWTVEKEEQCLLLKEQFEEIGVKAVRTNKERIRNACSRSIKCGPDELLPSGVSNRPSTMSNPTQAAGIHKKRFLSQFMNNTENDKKKFKADRPPCSPSRVLHIRQIPSDATEAEVISLAIPFGKVTNFLRLKEKCQALLEMDSEEAAAAVVNHCNYSVPHLHSQPVYIQYSKHRELKTNSSLYQATAQAALEAENAMEHGIQAGPTTYAVEGGHGPYQGSVLRIIVENLHYPVTIEVLYQIFSRFGSVLRIVIFTRNNQFQALLQYADPMNAYYAKMNLDGHNIYPTCCTLHIEFSRLGSLEVKYNTEKSRDFTRLDLPFDEGQHPLELSMAPAYGTQNFIIPSYTGAPGFAPAMAFTPVASYSFPVVPAPVVPAPVALPAVSTVPANSVLLVSNLNPEAITPHGLFILFGMYGDVHRVKIMFKKKSNALVQMADGTQAQLAMGHLNGQKLYGRVIHATLSKHQIIQLPPDGKKGNGLTKDYSDSPLHRFRKSGSKNFQNISPPSDTLHLSNIPPFVTVEDMENLFENTGSTVKAFRFIQKKCRMALIQLGSVEEAFHALIALHNHDLGEENHLRISFSKYTI